jgi:hypothetical protein
MGGVVGAATANLNQEIQGQEIMYPALLPPELGCGQHLLLPLLKLSVGMKHAGVNPCVLTGGQGQLQLKATLADAINFLAKATQDGLGSGDHGSGALWGYVKKVRIDVKTGPC